MTLSQLKTVCAAYLGKSVADLTIDSVDMFLMAANNVRKNAELLHDFEYTRVKATLSIDGANGADLADAEIEGSESGAYLVSGTLTADATGRYEEVGTVADGALYICEAPAGTFFLHKNGTTEQLGAWQISYSAFLAGAFDIYWVGPVGSDPVGSYTSFSGLGTATVTEISTAVFSGLKSITNIQRSRADGTYIPLDFTRADVAVERERTELEFQDDYFPAVRYPSDAQFLNRGSTSTLIQRGNKLFVYPVGTETTIDLEVVVEGYAFYRDYTADDLTSDYEGDLFLQQGSRFLQWAVITELNYLFQRFVPRQEGVLSPPEQAREAAWRDLLLWDSYLIDPNSTRSR